MYKYGEEISYSFELVGVGDYDSLQLFECTNERLDRHIREDIVQNNVVINEDGLYFNEISPQHRLGRIYCIIFFVWQELSPFCPLFLI